MGFGGRLAHRSCLCMGENEPILYVMASRRGEKKTLPFSLFFWCLLLFTGKQKKGGPKKQEVVTLSSDRAPPEIGNKISRDDTSKTASHRGWPQPCPGEAPSRCVGGGSDAMRPDEDADLQLAISLSKSLMVSTPASC